MIEEPKNEESKDTLVSHIEERKDDNKITTWSKTKTWYKTVNKKIILTLLMNHLDDTQAILKRKIDDVYLPEVLTADPDSDVRDVVKVMLELKLDAIPIVDDSDVLMGIISKTDILKAVANLPKLQLWS